MAILKDITSANHLVLKSTLTKTFSDDEILNMIWNAFEKSIDLTSKQNYFLKHLLITKKVIRLSNSSKYQTQVQQGQK